MSDRRRSDPMQTIRRSAAEAPHVAAHVPSGVVLRVVKVGGRAQGDANLAESLRVAGTARGARLIVVHGGGDEVTALQRKLGDEPEFSGGRRVTRAVDVDLVRMVLSGAANKRLVSQLVSVGVRAVGISGEDGELLTARVTDPGLGRVGGDVYADATIVADLLNAGWMPVISPLARDRESRDAAGLNVNGDDAAAAIAAGLGADELLFVADVAGVLDGESLLAGIDVDAIAGLVARGVVKGGMRAKLEAAGQALRNGVRRVRIASVVGIVDASAGTTITQSVPSTRDRR
jgi:acetylglutamate kinase